MVMREDKQLLNLLVFIRVYSISGLNNLNFLVMDAFEKRYTPYPAQFRLDVLNYMNEHGKSIRKTAAIFNMGSTYYKSEYNRAGIHENRAYKTVF